MANDKDTNQMPIWVLPVFSWLVSLYFFTGIAANFSFTPSPKFTANQTIILSLWLFFAFLPFFTRIKIGKFLELEREIKKANTEIKEFKEEVRFNLSMVSTSINTIGNLSNQVTVNLPGIAALEEDKRKLDESDPSSKRKAEEIREELTIEGEDTVMALARTRIRIEYLLRKILAKHPAALSYYAKPAKFLSQTQLIRAFLKEYESYSHLEKPFLNVMDVCNAAMHSQWVSNAQAGDSLDVGARIIAILADVAKKQG
jgi:hypothetical protein